MIFKFNENIPKIRKSGGCFRIPPLCLLFKTHLDVSKLFHLLLCKSDIPVNWESQVLIILNFAVHSCNVCEMSDNTCCTIFINDDWRSSHAAFASSLEDAERIALIPSDISGRSSPAHPLSSTDN